MNTFFQVAYDRCLEYGCSDTCLNSKFSKIRNLFISFLVKGIVFTCPNFYWRAWERDRFWTGPSRGATSTWERTCRPTCSSSATTASTSRSTDSSGSRTRDPFPWRSSSIWSKPENLLLFLTFEVLFFVHFLQTFDFWNSNKFRITSGSCWTFFTH